jgi:hypothetical protein
LYSAKHGVWTQCVMWWLLVCSCTT